ncbi:HAD family hydrolase [Lampropedia aestuarii]|uniref:HAD family hydrolase n=1 Tax=Lampropedia aestuarii TaxID=2562762 RepID=UPI002468C10D|nr:HAD family hydrolase [Lampropedia aestuarii]MDH5858646.1 HAD hydrolase-like protein [Lampropedia aestuarii]
MKKLLITDVDNTLFDWQKLWYECFSAMSKTAIEISGIEANDFYSECSSIHQKYGTSEYAFVLNELPSFKRMYGDRVLEAMQSSIDSFRKARSKNLRLYPGVEEALDRLRDAGVTIAAFTESQAFYTNYRFRKLGLDQKVDYLYSPVDHDLPREVNSIRKYSPENYLLKNTEHRFIPYGEYKPNPHILLSIIEELEFNIEDTVYIGDNLLKDVFMAQQANVTDVYAAYGAAQHRAEEYDLLKKVTHWTPEMVEREQAALKPGAIKPTYTLSKNFSEILKIMGI